MPGNVYGLYQSHSYCPTFGIHDGSESRNYELVYNIQDPIWMGQSGWNWCNKCRGLFYGVHESSSACPADGGNHSGSGSGNYLLVEFGGDQYPVTDFYQTGWDWCFKCQGLFYGPHPPWQKAERAWLHLSVRQLLAGLARHR